MNDNEFKDLIKLYIDKYGISDIADTLKLTLVTTSKLADGKIVVINPKKQEEIKEKLERL